MEIQKQKLDYHVIASGSSGNAVRIGSIMVDCGVGFTEMKEDLYKVDTLLITHAHSDHVKPTTLESIRREFPRVRVFGNSDVAYRYDVDKVIGTMPFDLPKGRHIIPFDGHHDIPVTGYIIQMGGQNILYMTDSNEVNMPVDVPLDYVFLESNFDERKLAEIGKRYAKGSYDPIANAHRHLSTQKCREFYYVHRRSRDSELIELHKSSRFY